jgi:chlorobactene glucosyltransferase
MIYFIISTILFTAGLIILYWVHSQFHLDILVRTTPPPVRAPRISVCIPARDEERNIERCVLAVLAQDYPDFEVIVLDDRSTDATPAILRNLSDRHDRLRVITGSELPAGWAGKPHALQQAAEAAHGKWLCFVDADTFLSAGALSACYVKAIETGADLFTIMTRQIMGTFWEKVVLPLVMTALSVGFSPRRVNDPTRRDAVANGQFILIRRSVYDAIGGHAGVKDQIVEDKAISEKVKWNGYRLVVADGMQVARTRMYTSFPQMWEGWTKNIYLGLRDHPSMLLLGAFGATLALIAALLLPIWPMLGLVWHFRGGGWMGLAVIAESLIVWGVLLAVRALIARRMGIPTGYALTTPLGAGVFAALMLASAWKVLSGQGVTWRGRKYHPDRYDLI